MKTVSFVKYAGAGNDFILVDNRKGVIAGGLAKAARALCDRRFSIGADGLILLEKSKKADYRMRIINPDGSEAEMCGNGVRCLAHFAVAGKIAKPSHRIETGAGIVEAVVKKDVVKAHLTDPRDLKLGIRLSVNGQNEEVGFVNTGVPHAVVISPALESVDVKTVGEKIRNHAHFAPRGANANFISPNGQNAIRVRTYERGVEDETLACGTGSTASALVAAERFGFKSPVSVRTQGGETLKVYFRRSGGHFTDVHLEGKVVRTFEGRVTL